MPQLRIPANTRVVTKEIGDFRNSDVTVEAVSAAANPTPQYFNGSASFSIGFGDETLQRIEMKTFASRFGKAEQFLLLTLTYGGFTTLGRTVLKYDPVLMRWWRFRQRDEYIEFGYSPDRTEWFAIGNLSFSPRFEPELFEHCNIQLAHIADRGLGPVVFDNLNVTPIPESDPSTPRQRTNNYMNFTSNFYSAKFNGAGVKIGIADQGTTPEVRAHTGTVLAGKRALAATGYPADQPDVAVKGGNHGCLVAGCLLPPGGARLYDVIIAGTGGVTSYATMAAAINYATERGAQVVNLSYGGTDSFYTPVDPGMKSALDNAAARDALVFISAGNTPQYDDEAAGILASEQLVANPGRYARLAPNTHCVGAFDERTDKRAYFSQWDTFYNPPALTGVAPGYQVKGYYPDGSDTVWDGTSASSPHAAQIAARLLTGAQFTAAQVGAAMKSTRRPTASPAIQAGGGKYDFDRALRVLLSQAAQIGPLDEFETARGFDLESDINVLDEIEEIYEPGVESEVLPAIEADTSFQMLFSYGLRPARELEVTYPPQVRTAKPPLYVTPIEQGGARVIAQSMVTGRFLHWDLPVVDLSITETLSGPGAISGKLNPDVPDIRAVPLTPWGTWIHVEDEHGLIRASGILTTPFGVTGAERSLEAVGVSAWIKDITYDGAYGGYEVDPLDVVRGLWDHAQYNWPNGRLGVIVSDDTSKVRIGGKPPDPGSTLSGPRIEIGEGPQVVTQDGVETIEYKPYKLVWWEHTSIGGEIDKLAANTPFDYIERSAWKPDRSGVDHFIDLRWPRAGTRRNDLRFADGENIRDSIPVTELDSAYVTDVRVFGAGEGQDMIVGVAATRAYPQVRRVVSLTEKSIKSPKRAKAVAEAELLRRTQPRGMEKILVDAGHENAPVGSFSVGDDIYIQTEVDWIGEINMWHRVLNFTYTPDEEAVSITVAPSSTFRYGNDA